MSLGPTDVTSSIKSYRQTFSSHVARFRSHDWASTPFGQMSSRSLDLRRMVNMCMADPRAVALWWGPFRICLYNKAYQQVLADRNQWRMGKELKDVWHEILDTPFGQSFDKADASGEPSVGNDACFFGERNGRLTEVWASWSVIPIAGQDCVFGYYNSVTESTRQILYERRMSILLSMEQMTATVTSSNELWQRILSALQSNVSDITLAVHYAAESDEHTKPLSRSPSRSDSKRSSVGRSPTSGSDKMLPTWLLQKTFEYHQSAERASALPRILDYDSATELFGPLFSQAMTSSTPQMLQVEQDTFPDQLRSKMPSESTRSAALFAVRRSRAKYPQAFLLIGLNPRCHYDKDYEQFILLICRQISSSLVEVTNGEQELLEAQLAAEKTAQERIQLTTQLAFSEQKTKESELRFHRMADAERLVNRTLVETITKVNTSCGCNVYPSRVITKTLTSIPCSGFSPAPYGLLQTPSNS